MEWTLVEWIDQSGTNGAKWIEIDQMDQSWRNGQKWAEWTEVDRIEPSGSKLNVIGRSGPKRTELDRNARVI